MAETTAKPRRDGRVWSDELKLFVHPSRLPWRKETPSPYELTEDDGFAGLGRSVDRRNEA
jgi:hypothetical protein